jgi:hypothetical protein
MSEMGLYKGLHYTGWVEDVKQLKREKRFTEAEILLKGLVETVKAESKASGSYPPPWYFGELASLYHKQERFAEELALLVPA